MSEHKVIFSLRINQMLMAADKGITWITHVSFSSLPSFLSPVTEAGNNAQIKQACGLLLLFPLVHVIKLSLP